MGKATISERVLKFAKEHKFGKIEYAGTTKNGIKVYSEVHEPDENGLIMPTGYPYLILEDMNGELSRMCSSESLKILRSIIR